MLVITLHPFPRITLFESPNEVGTIILPFHKEGKTGLERPQSGDVESEFELGSHRL